ncbi:hypothetical protein J6590_050620 [Homalodisca vitripennis]|nr:hypothetical protein J6590_050620 [Homalodisca vitripennis]
MVRVKSETASDTRRCNERKDWNLPFYSDVIAQCIGLSKHKSILGERLAKVKFLDSRRQCTSTYPSTHLKARIHEKQAWARLPVEAKCTATKRRGRRVVLFGSSHITGTPVPFTGSHCLKKTKQKQTKKRKGWKQVTTCWLVVLATRKCILAQACLRPSRNKYICFTSKLATVQLVLE